VNVGSFVESDILGHSHQLEIIPMKEPGLDGRHRRKDGEIQRKRDDALNKNLPKPIPQFSQNATLRYMRKVTGKESEADVRRAAAKMKK
jgi:hypothetical protein